jgi:hypothetical protein
MCFAPLLHQHYLHALQLSQLSSLLVLSPLVTSICLCMLMPCDIISMKLHLCLNNIHHVLSCLLQQKLVTLSIRHECSYSNSLN